MVRPRSSRLIPRKRQPQPRMASRLWSFYKKSATPRTSMPPDLPDGVSGWKRTSVRIGRDELPLVNALSSRRLNEGSDSTELAEVQAVYCRGDRKEWRLLLGVFRARPGMI